VSTHHSRPNAHHLTQLNLLAIAATAAAPAAAAGALTKTATQPF